MPNRYSNESNIDRAVRILLGLTMLTFGWAGPTHGILKIALEIFGWVPLITGITGWCPLYTLAGISTRKRNPTVQS